jgi:predicted amidohydrolase YtcJ
MTAEEAVRGYTVWGAFAGFDEQEAGMIAVGKRADVTVLTVDPFRATSQELLRGAVVMTVSRGRVVYRR